MNLEHLAAVTPQLIAMAVLIVCSAFFAGSETSLFSLSRATRERLSRSEHAGDRYVATLVSDPKRLIATLLVGNELINISFASLSASATEHVFEGHDPLTITLIATGITVPLLLFLGEILPKTIALALAEGWSRAAARPLGLFMILTTPVRMVVTSVANLVVRLLGQAGKGERKQLGEDEFKALVDAGSETGELQVAERQLIHNVFEFADRTVAEIMTPSKDVFSLSFELPLGRVVADVAKSGYSRVPIHRGKQKEREIIGVLFAKDLVGWSSGRLAQKTLKDLVRSPAYVPKTSKCAQVFQEFQRTRTHFAMVVDEYGRQVGLVTMEDLLTELFGQLGQEPRGSVPRPVGDPASGPLSLPIPLPPSEGGPT